MEQRSLSSSSGLNLETAQPMMVKNLDSETGDSAGSLQLTFRLVPEEKHTLWEWAAHSWRKLWHDRTARALIILGWVIVLGVGLQWLLFFSYPAEREDTVGQITCFAQHPRWIAPLDEEALSLTLFNSGNTDLSCVKVRLVFTDTLCLSTDEGGSTTVEFGDLTAGERKTKTVRFTLGRMARYRPMAEVLVRLISVEQGVESVPDPYTMRVFPTSHYKTAVQKAWGLLLSAILVVLGALVRKLPDISGPEN